MRELAVYESRQEVVSADSGRRYVVNSVAFWDSEPWRSELYVIVRVHPTGAWWRRILPSSAVVVRTPPG